MNRIYFIFLFLLTSLNINAFDVVEDKSLSDAIARVVIHHPNGQFNYYCTGSLINKRFVLTARHCAENMNVPAVILGRGENAREVEVIDKHVINPNQSFNNFLTRSNQLAPGWSSLFRTNRDMLILELGEDVLVDAYFRMQKVVLNIENFNSALHLIGFPKNSTFVNAGLPEPVYSARGCSLKEVLGDKSEAIYHTCYSEGGVSGGPIFYYDSNGRPTIIAVLSFGNAKKEDPLGVGVTTFGADNLSWLSELLN